MAAIPHSGQHKQGSILKPEYFETQQCFVTCARGVSCSQVADHVQDHFDCGWINIRFLELACEALAALKSHCASSGGIFLPSVSADGPKGLAVLAQHLQRLQLCSASSVQEALRCECPEDEEHASENPENSQCTGIVAGALPEAAAERSPDSPRSHDPRGGDSAWAALTTSRLRARLHLEVLRVVQWCLYVLGIDVHEIWTSM